MSRFSLDSWHEVGQSTEIIARYDIPLEIWSHAPRHYTRPDNLFL